MKYFQGTYIPTNIVIFPFLLIWYYDSRHASENGYTILTILLFGILVY